MFDQLSRVQLALCGRPIDILAANLLLILLLFLLLLLLLFLFRFYNRLFIIIFFSSFFTFAASHSSVWFRHFDSWQGKEGRKGRQTDKRIDKKKERKKERKKRQRKKEINKHIEYREIKTTHQDMNEWIEFQLNLTKKILINNSKSNRFPPESYFILTDMVR